MAIHSYYGVDGRLATTFNTAQSHLIYKSWGQLSISIQYNVAGVLDYFAEQVGRGGYARSALMTRGLRDESDDRLPVPRSNPGAATFAFAKLRKRFRRPHPQV